MAKLKTSKKSKFYLFNKKEVKLNSSQKLFIGSSLFVLSFVLFLSFTSYFFTGISDQSTLEMFVERDVVAENWMSKIGAFIADLFLHKGFGVSSYIVCFLTFLSAHCHCITPHLFFLITPNHTNAIQSWWQCHPPH